MKTREKFHNRHKKNVAKKLGQRNINIDKNINGMSKSTTDKAQCSKGNQ